MSNKGHRIQYPSTLAFNENDSNKKKQQEAAQQNSQIQSQSHSSQYFSSQQSGQQNNLYSGQEYSQQEYYQQQYPQQEFSYSQPPANQEIYQGNAYSDQFYQQQQVDPNNFQGNDYQYSQQEQFYGHVQDSYQQQDPNLNANYQSDQNYQQVSIGQNYKPEQNFQEPSYQNYSNYQDFSQQYTTPLPESDQPHLFFEQLVISDPNEAPSNFSKDASSASYPITEPALDRDQAFYQEPNVDQSYPEQEQEFQEQTYPQLEQDFHQEQQGFPQEKQGFHQEQEPQQEQQEFQQEHEEFQQEQFKFKEQSFNEESEQFPENSNPALHTQSVFEEDQHQIVQENQREQLENQGLQNVQEDYQHEYPSDSYAQQHHSEVNEIYEYKDYQRDNNFIESPHQDYIQDHANYEDGFNQIQQNNDPIFDYQPVYDESNGTLVQQDFTQQYYSMEQSQQIEPPSEYIEAVSSQFDPSISRPPVPVCNFGSFGTAAVVFPLKHPRYSDQGPKEIIYPSQVHLIKLKDVQKIKESDVRLIEQFPGPIVHKSTKLKDVGKFLNLLILNSAKEEKLLYQLLLCAVENDGILLGALKTESLIKSFLREEQVQWKLDTVFSKDEPITLQQMQDLTGFLSLGDRSSACKMSMSLGLWSHALLISMNSDREMFSNVVSEFATSSFSAGNPLRILYLLQAGKSSQVISELEANNQEILLGWRQIIAILLSNRTVNDLKIIEKLSDLLRANGNSIGAQICDLLLGRLCFIQVESEIRSLQLTEVLEFVFRLQSSNFCFPEFQLKKIEFVKTLLDLNQQQSAQKYCESILQIIEGYNKSSAIFTKQLTDHVKSLILPGMITIQSSSSSSWLPISGILSAIDRGITKVIGVEPELAPVDQSQIPSSFTRTEADKLNQLPQQQVAQPPIPMFDPRKAFVPHSRNSSIDNKQPIVLEKPIPSVVHKPVPSLAEKPVSSVVERSVPVVSEKPAPLFVEKHGPVQDKPLIQPGVQVPISKAIPFDQRTPPKPIVQQHIVQQTAKVPPTIQPNLQQSVSLTADPAPISRQNSEIVKPPSHNSSSCGPLTENVAPILTQPPAHALAPQSKFLPAARSPLSTSKSVDSLPMLTEPPKSMPIPPSNFNQNVLPQQQEQKMQNSQGSMKPAHGFQRSESTGNLKPQVHTLPPRSSPLKQVSEDSDLNVFKQSQHQFAQQNSASLHPVVQQKSTGLTPVTQQEEKPFVQQKSTILPPVMQPIVPLRQSTPQLKPETKPLDPFAAPPITRTQTPPIQTQVPKPQNSFIPQPIQMQQSQFTNQYSNPQSSTFKEPISQVQIEKPSTPTKKENTEFWEEYSYSSPETKAKQEKLQKLEKIDKVEPVVESKEVKNEGYFSKLKSWLPIPGLKSSSPVLNEPKKANLGEESTFKWDPEKKRWLNPNSQDDLSTTSAPTPPAISQSPISYKRPPTRGARKYIDAMSQSSTESLNQ